MIALELTYALEFHVTVIIVVPQVPNYVNEGRWPTSRTTHPIFLCTQTTSITRISTWHNNVLDIPTSF